jgi:uncharacterized membrane protein
MRVHNSQRDRVVRALRAARRPLTTMEVSIRARVKRRSVIVALCSLARDGKILRLGECCWERTWMAVTP